MSKLIISSISARVFAPSDHQEKIGDDSAQTLANCTTTNKKARSCPSIKADTADPDKLKFINPKYNERRSKHE